MHPPVLEQYRSLVEDAPNPKIPTIQIVPTWGLKSMNGTYFGPFGVLGQVVRNAAGVAEAKVFAREAWHGEYNESCSGFRDLGVLGLGF